MHNLDLYSEYFYSIVSIFTLSFFSSIGSIFTLEYFYSGSLKVLLSTLPTYPWPGYRSGVARPFKKKRFA